MYIVPHNPEWKNSYKLESESILQLVDIDIQLYHIGSTSIDGLSAKDCIDILGVIDCFEQGNELIKPLQGLGYVYKGEHGISKRHYFSKVLNRKVHLHICPVGHEQITRHLHFVSVMRSDTNLVDEFNELKTRLAMTSSKESYQIQKKSYYEKILAIELNHSANL